MADVAGLVISVATAWKTCVQIFEIVDTSRKYGWDYEVLRIKLEVERVRLLAWGEAVGLAGLNNSQIIPDPRLRSREIQSMVMGVFGCIQNIFENSEALQNKYGLRPSESHKDKQVDLLRSVFKREYNTLLRSAKERQRSTTLARKTLWAVHDKRKFQSMVAEIKGFNENLETLFPDVKIKAAEAMRQDIGRSDQIQDLRLLQEATAGEYEDISESASVRLETLGATVTDISDIVSLDDDTVIWGESDEEDDSGWAVGQGEGEEVREIPRPREKEIVQLSKRLHGAVLFETMKNLGALRVSLRKPDDALGRAFTHLSWDGYPPVETWDPEDSCWAYKMTVLGTPHPSFACRTISQKKFIHRQHMRAEFAMSTEEDYVFFDIESDPEYQSAYYGTVTCDGFGLECWDYEVFFGKQRDMDVLVIYNDLPALPDGSKILRRLDELCQDTSQVGLSNSNSWHDMTDLEEFTGELALAATKGIVPTSFVVADLCSLLSNQNVIADFTTTASGAEEWRAPTDRSIGLWNFLRQMIITNELARRLSCDAEGQVRGFTTKVLASLIIADRWFQNVQIRLVDTSVDTSSIPKTVSSLQKPKAEDFKRQGNEATRKKLHQRAVELYTEAVKADSGNVVYRNNRSGALYDLGKNQEALDDALIATKLDPTYAKAWARLGLAHLRLGRGKRAKEALQRAIELAGRNVTDTMRQGLEDANAKIEADMNAIAIEQEKNKKGARRLHVAFLDEDWDLTGRTVAMDSRVYARQTEGLVLFAERMRWPYLEEVGNYAETVYGDLVGGQTIPSHLHDWMYGMMLPGKWFAFKIMSALIICSRSIRHKIGLAPYYDCGDLLPQASYWRVRTPLGSILGCLPGARSLNGWLGPCPPVRFISTLDADKPRHIRVHARRLAPLTTNSEWDDRAVLLQGEDVEYEARCMKLGEEVEPYLAAMTDRNQWVLPEEPVQQASVCEMKAIELQALPSPKSAPVLSLGVEMREERMDRETDYQARIVFQTDGSERTVAYTLYTNPIFVSLPACRFGPRGNHELHLREVSQYQNNIWTVERLKEQSVDTIDPDSVIIINATGRGCELMARAWCAERGRNAIVCRAGAPVLPVLFEPLVAIDWELA